MSSELERAVETERRFCQLETAVGQITDALNETRQLLHDLAEDAGKAIIAGPVLIGESDAPPPVDAEGEEMGFRAPENK